MKVVKTRKLLPGRMVIADSGMVMVRDAWTGQVAYIPEDELLAAAQFLIDAAIKAARVKPLGVIHPKAS